MFKVAAVAVSKIADAAGTPSAAPTVGAPAPVDTSVPATVGGPSAQVEQEV
jgi:hypothetical protein